MPKAQTSLALNNTHIHTHEGRRPLEVVKYSTSDNTMTVYSTKMVQISAGASASKRSIMYDEPPATRASNKKGVVIRVPRSP